MTNIVTIHPAPDYPGGGYAVIRVTDPIGLSGTARISVFDLFRERYLGEHDWQPDPFEFGPYQTTAKDETVEFCVGPEIVNRVPEFTSVRIEVGGHPTTLTWPDDILQDPTAASYSTIYREDEDASELVEETVTPPAAPVEDPVAPKPHVEPPVAPEPTPKLDPAVKKPKSLMWLWILLLAVAISAVAVWWFVLRETTDPIPLVAFDCSLEGALAGDGGPIAVLAGLADASDAGDCDPPIDASFALRLIEQAAVNGDPRALATLGDIYSEYTINQLVEERLGVSLSEDPVIAFDYYRRAQEAGGADIDAQLTAICEGTEDTGDMMIQLERGDLCQ